MVCNLLLFMTIMPSCRKLKGSKSSYVHVPLTMFNTKKKTYFVDSKVDSVRSGLLSHFLDLISGLDLANSGGRPHIPVMYN